MKLYTVANKEVNYYEEFYNLTSAKKAMKEHNAKGYIYKIYSNENFYSLEIAEKIKGIPKVVDSLLESVKKYYIPEERIQNVSVRMLEYYAEYALKMSEIGVAKALGNNDVAKRIFEEFLPRYLTFELYFMNCIDMHQTVRVMRELVACRSDKNGDGNSEITVI